MSLSPLTQVAIDQLQKLPTGRALWDLSQRCLRFSIKEARSKKLRNCGYVRQRRCPNFLSRQRSLFLTQSKSDQRTLELAYLLQIMLNRQAIDILTLSTQPEDVHLLHLVKKYNQALAWKQISSLQQELQTGRSEEWFSTLGWQPVFNHKCPKEIHTSKRLQAEPLLLSELLQAVEQCLLDVRLRNNLHLAAPYQKMIHWEQRQNDLRKMHESYKKSTDSTLPLVYQPGEQNIFSLPYVQLAPEEVDCYGQPPDPKFFRQKKYIYFIHPASLALYPALLENHKLYWDDFYATALSSSRRLLVWNKNFPPFQIKTALDAVVSGAHRLHRRDECIHSAAIMSQVLIDIPQTFFQKIKLFPCIEPTALVAANYNYGTTWIKHLCPPSKNCEEIRCFTS